MPADRRDGAGDAAIATFRGAASVPSPRSGARVDSRAGDLHAPAEPSMNAPRSSSWLRWLLILVVLGGGGWAGFRYWRKPKVAPLEFKTAAVARGDIAQVVTANGSLNPVRNVEVGSQISGTILDLKVDFNSRVKAGEIIAQIDPATYERAMLQAEAELANAEAALELAQLNFERSNELYSNRLISKSEYDQAKVSLRQAQATVKTREANVERAKVDLSRTTIYAPIDGIVISRRVEVGQTVAASLNTPTLFVIANDLTRMQIEAAVSEADVGGVEEGQSVQFTVDAFPSRKFSGLVRQVRYAPVTNQNVVNYTTVVDVQNPDLKLRPGMTANASIVVAERKGILKIPNAAVRFRPPDGAILRGDTNAPAAAATPAPAREIATSGPFAGLPVPPWQAERRRPTDAERSEYEQSLSPEQKQQYREAMERLRARMAAGGGGGGMGGMGGGGGGFGGGGSESAPAARRSVQEDGPRLATVYLVDKESQPMGGERTVLRPASVKIGISDGSSAEVLEGLTEGDVVATGTVSASPSVATTRANPLGSPFGGPPRR